MIKEGDKLVAGLRARDLFEYLLVLWTKDMPWPADPVRKN